MTYLLAGLCVFLALVLLGTLAVIDFRTRLLPDPLVAAFAATGIAFHTLTGLQYLPALHIILGAALGFGLLFLIRAVANKIYQADALGFGDVKLMGAGGLWLGPDYILIAMIIGALAAMVHGLICWALIKYRTGDAPPLSRLQVPAGPGFILGLIVSGIMLLTDI